MEVIKKSFSNKRLTSLLEEGKRRKKMVEIILLTYLSLVVATSFSPIVVSFILLIEVLKAEICSLKGDTFHVTKVISNHFFIIGGAGFLRDTSGLGK